MIIKAVTRDDYVSLIRKNGGHGAIAEAVQQFNIRANWFYSSLVVPTGSSINSSMYLIRKIEDAPKVRVELRPQRGSNLHRLEYDKSCMDEIVEAFETSAKVQYRYANYVPWRSNRAVCSHAAI